MIVAYSRSNGAAANHEIAWVTVALQHLSVGEPFLGPDRSCAPVVADSMLRRVQPGHGAARAADAAPWPSLPLALRYGPGRRRWAGAKGIIPGPLKTRQSLRPRRI
jgi:hypothetical protein